MDTVHIGGEIPLELWERIKERTGAPEEEIIGNMAGLFDWAVEKTLQHETIGSYNELKRASAIEPIETTILTRLKEHRG